MRILRILSIMINLILMFSSPVFSQIKPFQPGEKITYDIKKFGIRVGGAELVYNGPQKYEGMDVILLTFTAHSLNFFDEEKIYMDPQTFFPIIVERDINVFGKKETIIERYQSDKGIVTLTKKSGDETSQEEIKKTGKLDNIYCFIYRYRLKGTFKVGDSLNINLPTKDVVMKVKKKTKIKAAGETHEAYFLETEPSQFSVWFEAGEKKIPLRIDGAAGIGQAVMIMTEFKAN